MSRGMLVLVLFALVASAGIGFVVGSSVGGGNGSEELREPERVSSEDPGRPVPPPTPRLAPPATVDIDRILDDAAPAAAPTGTGIITGKALKSDGAPLAGVLVRAEVRNKPTRGTRYHRGSGPPPEDEFEERLKKYAQTLKAMEAGRREATTGPDGAFVLDQIGDDTYFLRAWKEGYELRVSPGQRWEAKAGGSVVFTASPIFTVVVRVLLPDGSEAEKAHLDCSKARTNRNTAWTSEDPVVELDAGSWRVRARAGPYSAFNSDWVNMELEEGISAPPLTLTVKDGPGVAGRVVFPEGEQERYVTVAALEGEAAATEDPQALRRSRRRTRASKHDADWRYVIRDLPAGQWTLFVLSQSSAVMARKSVEVADRMVITDLEVPPADPKDLLLVRVHDHKGAQISSVGFTILEKGPRRSNSKSASTSRQPDGSWRLRLLRPAKEPEPGTKYFLRVHSRDHGTLEEEFTPGAGGVLELNFREPAKLTVTVTGYRGSGMEGKLSASLVPVSKGNSNSNSRFSYMNHSGSPQFDAEGKAVLGPANPGDYELRLSIRGDRRRGGASGTASRTPVTLHSGENTLTLPLPVLYRLTVLAPSGVSGRLHVRQIGGGGYRPSWGVTVKEGRGELENVPAGDYEITGKLGNSMGRMKFSIPAETTIRFTPESRNAYLVHIRNREGYATRAGLAQGDLVIGIDGEEFKNSDMMRALVTLANQKDACRITVLRGGRVLEMNVDWKKLWGTGGGAAIEMTSR